MNWQRMRFYCFSCGEFISALLYFKHVGHRTEPVFDPMDSSKGEKKETEATVSEQEKK